MRYIGIDTGVHTGVAVWDSLERRLERVETMTITRAMDMIREYASKGDITLHIEDARQRKWFGNTGRERLKGAGSVCRDASIWQTFCDEQQIRYRMVSPQDNRTKLSPAQFLNLTKWSGRTSEHSRDAALLVFGIRHSTPPEPRKRPKV